MFPLSNWTELDIWRYIGAERIEIPSIYFAHTRRCSAATACCWRSSRRTCCSMARRCSTRWSGTAPSATSSCTGAVESAAADVEEIVAEVAATRITERGATRADDRTSEAAMEDRKKEGYF